MNPALAFLIPALPAAAAALIALSGRALSARSAGALATLGGALALALASAFAAQTLGADRIIIESSAGAWLAPLSGPGISAGLGLRIDALASLMILLVSGFGTVIIFYSIQYMEHDENAPRYFASIAFFVAAMLTLVLADNLFLVFLGWEGVGLASYLLIGHYWREDGAARAAWRAFFVNRIGDALFLMGAFLLFQSFGTVSFKSLQANFVGLDAMGLLDQDIVAIAGALLLGGVFGKSAQVPLHVWLPDAMAGPTPVSALIHAATMVTAGVYFVARLDWLYASSPRAAAPLFIAGALTFVIGALLACSHRDIKKILAYSTLSNLGLMFLAHAAHASDAALLHLFAHAAFKALLFLAAGSVIYFAHHEQDLYRLHGVLRKLPVTRAAFWVGAIGSAGSIPFLSAGFFSKEAVLHAVTHAHFVIGSVVIPGPWVYAGAVLAEALAVFYTFRLLAVLDSPSHADPAGRGDHAPIRESGWPIRITLLVLIGVALAFSALSGPGPGATLRGWLGAGPEARVHLDLGGLLSAAAFTAISALVFMLFYRAATRARIRSIAERFARPNGPFARNFYFDDIYQLVITRPTLAIARFISDLIEPAVFIGLVEFWGELSARLAQGLKRMQRGLVNHYALALTAAFALLLLVFILLEQPT